MIMRLKICQNMNIKHIYIYIKKQARRAAFTELEEIRTRHNKGSQNEYISLNRPQDYIRSRSITSIQSFLLYCPRSRTVRGIKENWNFMGQENSWCPISERFQDAQSHVLNCSVMISIKPKINNHIIYENIDGSLEENIARIAKRCPSNIASVVNV